MRSAQAPRAFVVFSVVMILVAAGALTVSLQQYAIGAPLAFWLLALAIVVAENLSLDLPSGGSLSMAYPLSLAAAILLGPSAAGVLAGLSGISYDDFRRRTSVSVVVFNLGQLILSGVLGTWAYLGAGGRVLLSSASGTLQAQPFVASDFPGILLPLAVLAVVSFMLNAAWVSLGVSLIRGLRITEVWRSGIGWTAPIQFSLAFLGFVIAQVLAIDVWGLALFIVPLAVSRQMYRSYMQLRDAYLDTVRSLAGAIEAKDPYTRGHSERVAKYAAGIAERMGMSPEELRRIRLAALLHDLGKVGVSRRVLQKPTKLEAEERESIRRHPQIGASIVSRIPYLAELSPVVAAHHERVDGEGYAQGLRGNEIPLEARVLAVADCYDAMTTIRSYRDAMPQDEAIAEVRRCSGTQFDGVVVEAFVQFLEQESMTHGLDACDTVGAEAL